VVQQTFFPYTTVFGTAGPQLRADSQYMVSRLLSLDFTPLEAGTEEESQPTWTPHFSQSMPSVQVVSSSFLKLWGSSEPPRMFFQCWELYIVVSSFNLT
jgi:hypothetical protein